MEKTVPLDRHIKVVASLRQFAIGKHALGGDGNRTLADLQAGRELVAATRFGTGGTRGLVKQILKLQLAFLEAGGVDVRQVVGNVVQIQLLGLHPGGG